MDNKVLRILLVILVLFILPVVSAFIIAKLFVEGKGTLFMIIFISLIVLSIALSVYKVVRYYKNKDEE